ALRHFLSGKEEARDVHPLAATPKETIDLVGETDEAGPRFPAGRKPGSDERHFSVVQWVPSALTVAPSGEVTCQMPQPWDRKDHSVNVPSDFGITTRIPESEIRIRAPYGIRHSIGDVREKFNPRTSLCCSEDDSYGSDCVPFGVLMSSHVVRLLGSSPTGHSMPLAIPPSVSE